MLPKTVGRLMQRAEQLHRGLVRHSFHLRLSIHKVSDER